MLNLGQVKVLEENVLGRLVCGYSVEKQAAMEGRSMSMTLTPKSKK